MHEPDVHGGVNNTGDGERASGSSPLGKPSLALLDGLCDPAWCCVVDFRMCLECTIRCIPVVLCRGSTGSRAARLQLRTHQENDTSAGSGLSRHALANMLAGRQHNCSDRVCQFPHMGVLRISYDLAFNHATNKTGCSQTIRCAYRDTLVGAGHLHFSRGATYNS